MAAPPPRIPQRPGNGAAARPSGEDAIQKSKREKDELEKATGRIEEELEELKAKYDQYFLGNERREPVRQRDELKKRVLKLKEAFTRNTGLKFRIQSLHARYLSYERLWMRSAREKEEGTYRRDLFKARLHASQRGEPPLAPGAAREASDDAGPESPVAPQPAPAAQAPSAAPMKPAPPSLPVAPPVMPGAAPAPRPAAGPVAAPVPPPRPVAPAATPARPGAPVATAPPRPAAATPPPAAGARAAAPTPPRAPPAGAGAGTPPPGAGGMNATQMRALYDSYIAAKRSCNEDTSRLTFEAVSRSVTKQIPELMTRFKAKSVDFKVEVKDGKAVLKAIPKV